jgi:hypothetical protein
MTLRWVPGWNGLTEPEAVSYVAAVEEADGEPLEFGVAKAINDFVLGCKNDGIWDAIKASCILAGARTKEGAVVPLVNASGTTPTLNGTSGDWSYNRKTGLQGNGTNNYINSGRNNNAEQSQNSKHISCFCTTSQASGGASYFGASIQDTGTSAHFIDTDGLHYHTLHSSTYYFAIPSSTRATGLIGANRTAANSILKKAGSFTRTDNTASQVPFNGNVLIFARGLAGSINSPTTARLAFYSIGEALDLAILDTRVTTLINAIGAAIP